MIKLPESPRKIEAGWKLKHRNPSKHPARGMVANARWILCCISAANNMVTVAKNPNPAANPSMPSMKLNAFIQPTSHSTVRGKLHHQSKVEWPPKPKIRTSAQYAHTAAASWHINFCQGLRLYISSRTPVAK